MKESGQHQISINLRKLISKLSFPIIIILAGLMIFLSLLHVKGIPKELKMQLSKLARSSSVKSKIIFSEASYQRYIQKRKALVGEDPSKINPWPKRYVVRYFYDYFLPTFSCPHAIDRIGGLGDGGKYVCGLELFENRASNEFRDEPCVIYSFGVASESSYEAEMLERTNCEIYAYDASVSQMGPQVTASQNSRIHFNKMYIGANNTETTKTLGTLMKENGHKWIDFVKMDIEGNEVDVLNQIMDQFEYFPFAQISIEIHGDQEGKLFPKIYELWERLEKIGLRAYKNEVNNFPTVGMNMRPFLMEYSFINLRGEHRLFV